MEVDTQQRIDEIQSMLITAFASAKAPQIRSYDDKDALFIQLGWVVESNADTTLDARCVATLRIGHSQLSAYAEMSAIDREHARRQIDELLHARAREVLGPQAKNPCSLELSLPDAVFGK